VKHFFFVALTLFLALTAPQSKATETPIGKPKFANGMEISVAYSPPIKMEPEGFLITAKNSDFHLEADIHVAQKSPQGFAKGEWMPYLGVKFEIRKAGSDFVMRGDLTPMVDHDGPHYGANVKLDGSGIYDLKLTVMPPSENRHARFGRHTDNETGVAPWFNTFDVNFNFNFSGIVSKELTKSNH
jgi:periplasmic iron binding protein